MDGWLPGQLTALQQAAVQQHELYQSWVASGLTAEQAIYLLAAMLGGKLLPPSGMEEPPPGD